jgi:hypothetical protein
MSKLAINSGEKTIKDGEVKNWPPVDKTDELRANCELITKTFKAHGFVDYPFEFWHFSQGDAYDAYLTNRRTPVRYGAVDINIASGTVEPIADPLRNLNTPEELEYQIAAAVARLS